MIRKQCGTYAGVAQHNKHGEYLCDPCKVANREYIKDYRKKNPEAMKKQTAAAKVRARTLTILAQRHLLEYRQIYTDIKKEQ